MKNQKKKSKTKIFFGAYVNFPNAQNINCDNLARYLDKDKFEIHVMYSDKLPIDKAYYRAAGIHLHRLIHHRFIWYWCKLLTMLLGNYDLYYLPKMEPMDRVAARLLRGKKAFVSSIEGVVGEQIPTEDELARSYYEQMDGVFSISQCIRHSAVEAWGIETPVLYLGVEPPGEQGSPKNTIRQIIWVGSFIDRKRPEYVIELAKQFPQLSFTMIGDGDRTPEISRRIAEEQIQNVVLTGRIPNRDVYSRLEQADLLLMTSDKEGLPKVIGEAMSMYVPAIYINACYEVDYIHSGVNGFAVSGLDEMKEKLQYLQDHPAEFQKMSEAAEQSIRPYLWPELIQQYEEYFSSLVRKKS